jgi:hypothetical protein
MVARLQEAGILQEFAHLLAASRLEAETAYRKAGLPWPEPREQANLDWVIEDPEVEDVPEGDLDQMLEQAARAYRTWIG